MQTKTPAIDARWFQIIFQLSFLSYGSFIIQWPADYTHYAMSIGGTIAFGYLFECMRLKQWLPLTGPLGFSRWGFSSCISAMGLCFILKTNDWYISLFGALLAIGSKYIFRFRGKHLFNPSAFGIIAVIMLTNDAWMSPARWGSNVTVFFFIITVGTIVVTRVQKLDLSIAFLAGYIGLSFWRQVIVLNWPFDHFFHTFSTGSLLIFTFFMISDPKTSPNHKVARIIWAFGIGAVAFYLSAFEWKYSTPIWVLVAAAPLVPILDWIFKAKRFEWNKPKTTLQADSFLAVK